MKKWRLCAQRSLRMGTLMMAAALAFTGTAFAMPTGGTLVQGNVTIDRGTLADPASGATIRTTENSVIDWTDFDLVAAEELHFDTTGGALVAHVLAGKVAMLRGKISQTGSHPLTIIGDGGLSIEAAQIHGTNVELAATKMVMQDSSLVADRVQIRVGEMADTAEDIEVTRGAPFYLSNSIIRAKDFRSMSGAVYLLNDCEVNADTIDLSIGESIRISRGADGKELHEDIEVTRDNTLSLWESAVNGGDISFRTGNVGIWQDSVLEAAGKMTPIVESSNKGNEKYSLTRVDGSTPKLLCGDNSTVWQKNGGVEGFREATSLKQPPAIPAMK